MLEGKIISTIGGVYKISLKDNNFIEVTPRGKLKHLKKKLLIGDNVLVNEIDKTLEEVLEQNNSLIRPRIANIDLGIIVTSLVTPDFSSFLLNKFLTLLNASVIKPLVILTKVDLGEENKVKDIVETYQKIGVKVIPFSKKTNLNLDLILEEIKGKVVAFMGQTGVGKSSLINVIDPDFNRDIGEFSVALGRGKHQTKEVILLPFNDGYIADTPGFSSLELPLFKEELANSYIGFSLVQEKCKFNNCLHISEKECPKKEFLLRDNKLKLIYEDYLSMSDELIFRKDRY